jgi:hypothetical protein
MSRIRLVSRQKVVEAVLGCPHHGNLDAEIPEPRGTHGDEQAGDGLSPGANVGEPLAHQVCTR